MSTIRPGQVWIGECTRCGRLCFTGQPEGIRVRLSGRTIPAKHAAVLWYYDVPIFHVWKQIGYFVAALWEPSYGRPPEGGLVKVHTCTREWWGR